MSDVTWPLTHVHHEEHKEGDNERGGRYESYGFIEVGEPRQGAGYALKRSKSTADISPENVIEAQLVTIRQQLAELRLEHKRLSNEVKTFTEEQNRWSTRYSRRIVVLANLSLGVWIFWTRFLQFMKTRKNSILQGMVVPKLAGFRRSRTIDYKTVFSEGYMFAIKTSWVFFVSSYLLTRKRVWKRSAGLLASSAACLYSILFTTMNNPWANFFTLFANLLYSSVLLNERNIFGNASNKVPSLFERRRNQSRSIGSQ